MCFYYVLYLMYILWAIKIAPTCSFCYISGIFYYALFNSNLNLSAIIAINSEFVGLPLLADIV